MPDTPPIIGTPPPAIPPLLLTVSQTCQAINCCAKTLYNLEKRGQLRPIRITGGKRGLRYVWDDLQAFVQRAKTGGQP